MCTCAGNDYRHNWLRGHHSRGEPIENSMISSFTGSRDNSQLDKLMYIRTPADRHTNIASYVHTHTNTPSTTTMPPTTCTTGTNPASRYPHACQNLTLCSDTKSQEALHLCELQACQFWRWFLIEIVAQRLISHYDDDWRRSPIYAMILSRFGGNCVRPSDSSHWKRQWDQDGKQWPGLQKNITQPVTHNRNGQNYTVWKPFPSRNATQNSLKT